MTNEILRSLVDPEIPQAALRIENQNASDGRPFWWVLNALAQSNSLDRTINEIALSPNSEGGVVIAPVAKSKAMTAVYLDYVNAGENAVSIFTASADLSFLLVCHPRYRESILAELTVKRKELVSYSREMKATVPAGQQHIGFMPRVVGTGAGWSLQAGWVLLNGDLPDLISTVDELFYSSKFWVRNQSASAIKDIQTRRGLTTESLSTTYRDSAATLPAH
jgi:hypothetical protein